MPPHTINVCDSKDGDGAVLIIPDSAWQKFTDLLK
jgi:hypothetical protein